MSRVKITLPEHQVFTTTLNVRVSDLNYGNHLGNDSVLSLVHEARCRFYRSLGYRSEVDIEGVGTIQTDAAIVYRREAFYGDEIRIDLFVGDIEKKGFDLYYRLSNTQAKHEIARVKTGIVMFDYKARKLRDVPRALLEKLDRQGEKF